MNTLHVTTLLILCFNLQFVSGQKGISTLSVYNISLPDPCGGASVCDVFYSVCVLPFGSLTCESSIEGAAIVPAGETLLVVTDRDAFGTDTITIPSMVTYDVALQITVADALSEFAQASITQNINTTGSKDISLTLSVPNSAGNAVFVMESVTLCDTGYFGDTCSVACTPSSDNINGFFYCGRNGAKICSDGYTGTDCLTDVDECASFPCENGGSCTNTDGSFTCACVTGCSGNTCAFGASSITREMDTAALLAAFACVDSVSSITISPTLGLTYKICGDTGTACVNNLITGYNTIFDSFCDDS